MIQPIEQYRAFAERYLRWACGGAGGVSEVDNVYRLVTENRDTPGARPGEPGWYSSCADLAHSLLEACGVRFPWVNRKSLGQYRIGLNVSRLAYAPMARDPRPTDRFSTGDVLITWERPDTTDAHVMCVVEEPQGAGAIVIAEYGQPGGHVRSKGISRLGGHTSVGGKRVRRVLLLEDVLFAADRDGLLAPVRLDSDTDRAPPPSEPTTIAPPVDPSRLPTLSQGPYSDLSTPYVRLLQERLNATGAVPQLRVDGHFGARTRAAVIVFQRTTALKPDGVVGPLTWAALLRDVVAF